MGVFFVVFVFQRCQVIDKSKDKCDSFACQIILYTLQSRFQTHIQHTCTGTNWYFPQMSVACLWSQVCLRWQGKQEVCDSVMLFLTKQGGERVKVKCDWRENNIGITEVCDPYSLSNSECVYVCRSIIVCNYAVTCNTQQIRTCTL